MFESSDGPRFVVQSVRGHQKYVGVARRGDHGERFFFAHGERLLDHDMLPARAARIAVVGMHVVRQSDVDRVDRGARQQGVVAVIADNRSNAIRVRQGVPPLRDRRSGSAATREFPD